MKIKWCTIKVSNMERSAKFYRDFLGLKTQRTFSPFPGTEIMFLTDENGMELELLCSIDNVQPGNVSVGMESDDYERLLETAGAEGFPVSGPTVMGGEMECFFVSDPDGVQIQVIKPR